MRRKIQGDYFLKDQGYDNAVEWNTVDLGANSSVDAFEFDFLTSNSQVFARGGPVQTNIPGDVTTTATIGVNEQLIETIETGGDQDWFSITLVAGQTYDISSIGVGSNALPDPLLRIMDAAGEELATHDDILYGVVRSSLLTFTATTSGTYYISAQGWSDETGQYQLSVTENNDSTTDIAADTSTTAVAIVNGSVSGTIATGTDVDWFAVTLVAGQRYIISQDATGNDAEDAENPVGLDDAFLTLLDSTGAVIQTNDDSGPGNNARMSFVPTTTGTYYIAAGSAVSADGDYAVTIREVPTLAERTIDEVAHFLTDEFDTREAYGANEITYNITGLSEGAQALAIRALTAWADVSALTFTAVTTGGMIVFSNTEDGAFNGNTTTNGVIQSSTLNVETTWNGGNLNVDSYTYQTFLHEIGHALGLGHGGPYNAEATYDIDNIYLNDSWAYTVMSYFDQNESGYFGDFRFVLAPQISDIVAIQDLYGANTTTRSGDTVYGFNSTEAATVGDVFGSVYNFDNFTRAPSLSIYDTGGIDTLDFSGYSQKQKIDLRPESFSDVNGFTGVISIARGVIIENAIGGSGIDTIIGNDASNVLTGNGGNDILDGGEGIDYAVFSGASINEYTITENSDGSFTVAHNNNGADGTDTLTNIEFVRIGGVDTALGAEPFTTLSEGNDRHTGNDDDNRLDGLGGNDVIYAAGGNDVVRGGDGADRLFGDDGLDELSGDAGADYLYGGRGNDTLRGGAGGDFLYGGLGDDAMYGGAGGDVFIIFENAGTDTIFDFENGIDIIRILNGAISYSDLTVTQEGNAVHIVSSYGTIILDNFDLANVDASDFDFVGTEGRPVMVASFGDVFVGAGNEISIDIQSHIWSDLAVELGGLDTPNLFEYTLEEASLDASWFDYM